MRSSILVAAFLFIPQALFAQDTINGVVWYPPMLLSDSLYDAYEPSIALSGEDTLHVTYEWGGIRLAYCRSTNGGSTFEAVRELLPDTITYPREANRQKILSTHDDVYVLFCNPEIPFPFSSLVRMLRSTDGGSTFGAVTPISPDRSPEVTQATISGDTIALIYPPDGEYRKILRSTNRGQSWSRLDENIDIQTRIVLSPGLLHMVEHKFIDNAVEIGYRQSTDLGDNWGPETILSTVDGLWSDIPTVAAHDSKCGTEILVAWRDVKYGTFGIAGASITSRAGIRGGAIWLPEELQTPVPQYTEPRATLSNNIHALALAKEVSPFDTFQTVVVASNNSLLRNPPISDLTPSSGNAGNPAVAVSSHAIHLVWQEFFDPTFRVMYRRGEYLPSNASFEISTGWLDLGTTEVLAVIKDSVNITNNGTGSLVIGTALSNDENFSVSPGSLTIQPLASAPFRVSYTPLTFGSHVGRIIFYSNARSSPGCFMVTGTATWNHDTIIYPTDGWAMVSIPVKPAFPQSMPSLFSFEGTYNVRDSMAFGTGYWAKPAKSIVEFVGARAARETINVQQGWNMIGSTWKPVARSDILAQPDSLLVSGFFTYDGTAYIVADTLMPGRSYWVKVKKAGLLMLGAKP